MTICGEEKKEMAEIKGMKVWGSLLDERGM